MKGQSEFGLFQSAFLILNYSIYILPLCFYLSLSLYTFFNLFLHDMLYSWGAGSQGLPLLLFLQISFSPFSVYLLCLPVLHIISPVLLLAVELFNQTNLVFETGKITEPHKVKQIQQKNGICICMIKKFYSKNKCNRS